MITSRWKKVWADFWGSKSRAILTILTIMVGAFAVGFNSNLGLYMNESMDTDFLSAQPHSGEVYAYPMDDDMVKIARTVPGVKSVEGFSRIRPRIVRDDGTYVDILISALEDPGKLTVDMLKPPTPDDTVIPKYGDKEIILDYSALSLGYKPGDMILVELSDGKRRELRLAGYMHDVTGAPYTLANMANGYVTPNTMEWLGGTLDYDKLAVSVSENPTDQDHVTEVAQAVADRMKDAGATVDFVFVNNPGHHFAYSVAQGMFFVLGILGYLTVILSGFLVVNTITALMTQQTRYIGIMKAVGGSALQIFGMYVVLIMGFGALAFLIAAPLADRAALTIGIGMADWLNFWPAPYKGYTATYVQQALVALVAPLLAALVPIFNSVRVTVREALSDYGLGGSAKSKTASVNRNSTLLPRPIRISLRNTFRRKARLSLTLFTMVLGGAIFISIYNIWGSFGKWMNDIQGYFLADINVSFSRAYRFDKVSEMAKSVRGVESVEGWLVYTGTLKMNEDEVGKQIVFVAPPSSSTLIDPIISNGRWLNSQDENAIVIGNQLLNIYPNLQLGDWLTIDVDGKDTKWQIVGFYSLAGNLEAPYLYVNYEYMSRLVNQPGQVYSLRIITASHDTATQTRVNDELQAMFKARGVQVSSTQLSAEWVEQQQSQTDIFVYFMLIMASLIAIVGGLGLMGTMSINVLERTREIGVMRAIGASNGDIQAIVIIEGMVIGLLSWFISIFVSIPITNALAYGVGMSLLEAPLPTVYGWTGIFAWLAFTLALGTIASALPAHRASRLTVRDTLAYE